MTSRPLASLVAFLLWLVATTLWLAWTAALALAYCCCGTKRGRRKVQRAYVRFPRWGRIAAWLPGRRRQPQRPVVVTMERQRVQRTAREREALVLLLRRRDGDCCQLCGGVLDFAAPQSDPLAEEVDHVIPFSLGGDCDVSNLTLAHRACNQRKGNRVDLRRIA